MWIFMKSGVPRTKVKYINHFMPMVYHPHSIGGFGTPLSLLGWTKIPFWNIGIPLWFWHHPVTLLTGCQCRCKGNSISTEPWPVEVNRRMRETMPCRWRCTSRLMFLKKTGACQLLLEWIFICLKKNNVTTVRENDTSFTTFHLTPIGDTHAHFFIHDALIVGCRGLLLETVSQLGSISKHCWEILAKYCEISLLAASLQDLIVIGLTHVYKMWKAQVERIRKYVKGG